MAVAAAEGGPRRRNPAQQRMDLPEKIGTLVACSDPDSGVMLFDWVLASKIRVRARSVTLTPICEAMLEVGVCAVRGANLAEGPARIGSPEREAQ